MGIGIRCIILGMVLIILAIFGPIFIEWVLEAGANIFIQNDMGFVETIRNIVPIFATLILFVSPFFMTLSCIIEIATSKNENAWKILWLGVIFLFGIFPLAIFSMPAAIILPAYFGVGLFYLVGRKEMKR